MNEPLLPEQLKAVEYLTRKGTRASAEDLRSQARAAFASIEELFDGVAAEDRDRAPAAGKWSAREILDHLVLSHEPAIAQLESLLAGVRPGGVAIPAGLHREEHERPAWTELRDRLGAMHRAFLALLETASDDLSLEPKAVVEMVVKVGSEPKHWFESIDWKAFVQAVRVHTLEHRAQLAAASSQLAGPAALPES